MEEHKIEWEAYPESLPEDPEELKQKEENVLFSFLTAVGIAKLAVFAIVYFNPIGG